MATAGLTRKTKLGAPRQLSSSSRTVNATKMIYYFGRTKTEGNGKQKQLARRQGCEPRRDDEHRPAGAAGLHDHDRSVRPVLQERPQAAGRPDGRSRPQRRHAREGARQEVRRQRQSAARFGPQRRRRLDAGHDEHDSQPGPQRRSGRRPGQRHRQRAVRVRRLSPAHQHVRRRGVRRRARAVRAGVRQDQSEVQGQERHRRAASKA